MEIENKIKSKINRSKFFSLTGKGVLAVLALKLFPFSFVSAGNKEKKKIEVRINSYAVQRNNRGEKHV